MTMSQPGDKPQQGQLSFILLPLLLHISPENVANQNPDAAGPERSELDMRSKWV